MNGDNDSPQSVQSISQTNLPDYSAFVEELKQRLSHKDPQKRLLALFFIHFDDLTRFNDTFGFSVDESLALELSHKLRLLLKSRDMLARTCGSQYMIMQEISSSEDAERLASDILHMLSEPFMVDDHMFYIYASIGISFYPLDGENTYRLIKSAQSAMRSAQNKGTNHFEFAQYEAIPSYEKSVRIMADLPMAIESGEIDFLYQPQYCHATKRFCGAELLARWMHPEYGEISPGLFIPLAEQNGMISSLTVKALTQAAKAFSLLEENGIDDFSLSVNISPVFLMTSTFYSTMEFMLKGYQLNEKKLNLEITEEILMQNREYLSETLEKIKTLNIRIELDDFGTGNTSLQHLAYLPIDTLKIDRSFVSGIDKDERKRALFKAIVDMSRALDIDVIAEGVETSSEDEIIQKFDSMVSQGYFHSKPMQLNAMVETVKSK